MSIRMSPNQREVLSAISTISGRQEYLLSTNGVLNSTATISGTALPISGATTGVGVAILDGSGNQVTSFGGGTQYTDAGTPPTHPIGPTLEFNNAGTWATVGSANPLPVTASFSPSGTQDTNLKQINGNTTSVGNGVSGTGVQRVAIASDNTAFSVNATLSAETTKVIGVTRSADGSGNLLTSTGNALDINIKSGSIANTSFAATQATASSLNATVVGTGTLATQTTATVTTADKTGSGTIGALNATTIATTNGCSIVSFNIAGTWSATLLIEGTIDGGSTWIAIDGDVDATDTVINNTTSNGLVTVNCASYNQVRLRANPYTSGTANVTWSANIGLSLVEVFNTNGNSLRVQDLASGPTGATAPTSAQAQGNVAQTSLPTAVSAGQLTNNMADKFGRQVVLPQATRDTVLPITQLTLTATTTETTLISQVASTFNDIVSLVVINTSATASQVDFRDSTAGTIRLSLYVPAGDTRGIALPVPLPQNAVNTNWTAKCGTSVSSVIITGSYVANK